MLKKGIFALNKTQKVEVALSFTLCQTYEAEAKQRKEGWDRVHHDYAEKTRIPFPLVPKSGTPLIPSIRLCFVMYGGFQGGSQFHPPDAERRQSGGQL